MISIAEEIVLSLDIKDTNAGANDVLLTTLLANTEFSK